MFKHTNIITHIEQKVFVTKQSTKTHHTKSFGGKFFHTVWTMEELADTDTCEYYIFRRLNK